MYYTLLFLKFLGQIWFKSVVYNLQYLIKLL